MSCCVLYLPDTDLVATVLYIVVVVSTTRFTKFSRELSFPFFYELCFQQHKIFLLAPYFMLHHNTMQSCNMYKTIDCSNALHWCVPAWGLWLFFPVAAWRPQISSHRSHDRMQTGVERRSNIPLYTEKCSYFSQVYSLEGIL